MQLSGAEIKLVKQNKSQFVSLKYLDDDGILKQIDSSLESIEKRNLYICNDTINLKPINGKGFIDPFRSLPTTSFFCENIASKINSRKLAVTLLKDSNDSIKSKLSIELSFWITNNDDIALTYVADPSDKHANFRSDVVSTLEKIGIKTTSHFHGKTSSESVIGILGDNIIDLSDNLVIAKYIISNIADSYCLKASFTLDSNANLSLIIIGSIDEQNKIFLSMKKNIEHLSLIASQFDNHGFKLLELHNHKITNSNAAFKISLYSEDLFIPYLAFVELLIYSENKNLTNKNNINF